MTELEKLETLLLKNPNRFTVEALVARKGAVTLAAQAKALRAQRAIVEDEVAIDHHARQVAMEIIHKKKCLPMLLRIFMWFIIS